MAQAEESSGRDGKYFIIKQGEMKCEDCWLQVIFAERVAEMKAERREAQRSGAWQLPDSYAYFCVTCKKVTDWKNLANGKLSKCTDCSTEGTNKKRRCNDCHELGYLYM
mmetsp:Transcript_30771/g.38077  ORF Transcript_30771/g.38077 Transcript_30771/m.38077 type:complete len:109 (-) Transcript_30771:600-926(-)